MPWIKHINILYNLSKFKKIELYRKNDPETKVFQILLLDDKNDYEILSFESKAERNSFFHKIEIML
jgi:hypothetical protein